MSKPTAGPHRATLRLPLEPTYFATPADLRSWLATHHTTETALWIGFHKRHTKTPSIAWPESVDEALCFGWIDGIRKSLGPSAYAIRFTPRKPTSIWSAVNIGRAKELRAQGLMAPAGAAAFDKRDEAKSAIYAYEQRRAAALPRNYQQALEANRKAFRFFEQQPPWYRRTATYYVISAKRENTRERRLSQLIAACAKGERLSQFISPAAQG